MKAALPEINQRLSSIIDHFANGSRKKFAEIIGVSPQVINRNFNLDPRSDEPKYPIVSTSIIDKIIGSLKDLNTEWLLTGEGSMLKSETQKANTEVVHLESIPEPKPHIEDAYADCGVPNGFDIAIKASDCELVSIPFISSNYDFSIRARGDSMINRTNPNRSIKDKDIVICKLWRSRTHIRWGEVYVLATVNGVIIKKVLPVDGDTTKIICESFNKEDNFPNYTLNIDEILDWATVEGVFCVSKW